MSNAEERPSAGTSALPALTSAPGDSAAAVQTVLEQQGLGRVLHRPDGTIVWEPLPEGTPSAAGGPGKVQALLEVIGAVTGVVVLWTSTMVAFTTSDQHVTEAHRSGKQLTTRELTTAVTHTVASTIAGMLAGAVLGPVSAVAQLVSRAAGPLAVGLVGYKGFVWARRHLRGGVLNLIRRLQSGDLRKVLEALRAIAARALSNEAFRKEFARFSGIQALLQMVADALAKSGAVPGVLPPGTVADAGLAGSPLLQLVLQALEALLRSHECREACISAGGPQLLVSFLACMPATSPASAAPCAPHLVDSCRLRKSSSSSTVSSFDSGSDLLVPRHAAAVGRARASKKLAGGASGAGLPNSASLALSCLSHLSCHPAVQDTLRENGGLSVIVMLASQGSAPHATAAIKLVQKLASDASIKDALGLAGGIPALLTSVESSISYPHVQLAAISALQTLLRGSPMNQLALAHTPDSFARLSSCHSALGTACHPCKSGLQALMGSLSRFPNSLPCHVGTPEPNAAGGRSLASSVQLGL